MLNSLMVLAADGVEWPRALAIMAPLIAVPLALGWLGVNYMKAIGRNPEAGEKATQIVIIAAMIELSALLSLVLAFTFS